MNDKPAARKNRSGSRASKERAHDGPVCRVKILHSSATDFFACPGNLNIADGDHVVVPTRYGRDIGRVLGLTEKKFSGELQSIARIVSEAELEKYEKSKDKDRKAFEICKQKIAEFNLNMKLVSAHYLFGDPKILFFFTAESRVDFRELVKTLVSIFKTRIELRQIGVRDESRVLGGLGVCGRGYCCHSMTDKLNPVSIKMAKKQNLSLNSLKISGPCGRLLCCLAYEYPHYKEEKDRLPSEGTRIAHDGERCKIVEVNILSRCAKLSGESGRFIEIPFDRLQFNKSERRWIVADEPE
jgi:cell fate regulator YaaT (PSP1 superfamily)